MRGTIDRPWSPFRPAKLIVSTEVELNIFTRPNESTMDGSSAATTGSFAAGMPNLKTPKPSPPIISFRRMAGSGPPSVQDDPDMAPATRSAHTAASALRTRRARREQ